MPPANTGGMLWACSPSQWSPKGLQPPGSCPVYLLDRNTVGPLPLTPDLFSGSLYHPPPTPLLVPDGPWRAARSPDNGPGRPRHSKGRRRPRDAATDAYAARCREPIERPWAPHSCVRLATTTPCSSSSTERSGQHALRLQPGPRYMPQSVAPVGLARCLDRKSTRLNSSHSQISYA